MSDCETEIKREAAVPHVQTEVPEDVLRVPARLLLVVVEIEIVPDRLLAEQIGVKIQQLMGDLGGLAEIGFSALVLRSENVGVARRRQLAVAIAAPGGLSDGIQSCKSPVNHRKIHIHPRFDQLRGNDAHRQTFAKPNADLRQDPAAMLRTHQRGKVIVPLRFPQQLEKLLGMFTAIDDAKHLQVVCL